MVSSRRIHEPQGLVLLSDFLNMSRHHDLTDFQARLGGPFLLFRIKDEPSLVVNLRDYVRADRWDLLVGRNDLCDIMLADSTLSRHHARLDFHEPAWTLTDLGSSNGTVVAGRQLEAQRPELLRDQAEIYIGRETYSMFYEASSFYMFCNEYHKRNRRESRRLTRPEESRPTPKPSAATERYSIRSLFPGSDSDSDIG